MVAQHAAVLGAIVPRPWSTCRKNDATVMSSTRCDTHRTMYAVSVRPREHYAFPLLGCFCAAAPAAPLAPTACTHCSGAPDGAPAAAAAEAVAPPQLVQLQFVGAGFLKHQVRRLVGLLVRIGLGEEAELGVVRSALEDTATFDRRRAPTAPAEGLWLERVE